MWLGDWEKTHYLRYFFPFHFTPYTPSKSRVLENIYLSLSELVGLGRPQLRKIPNVSASGRNFLGRGSPIECEGWRRHSSFIFLILLFTKPNIEVTLHSHCLSTIFKSVASILHTLWVWYTFLKSKLYDNSKNYFSKNLGLAPCPLTTISFERSILEKNVRK